MLYIGSHLSETDVKIVINSKPFSNVKNPRKNLSFSVLKTRRLNVVLCRIVQMALESESKRLEFKTHQAS